MNTIRINVNDYYNNPSYYSVMDESIFDMLEHSFLEGKETCEVNKELFDKMIVEYNKKMNQ